MNTRQLLCTKKASVLDLPARRLLYQQVQARPGIYIRELQRETQLALGQLTYHLFRLLKARLIEEEADAHFRRFYPRGFAAPDRKLLSLLNQQPLRRIILYFLEHAPCVVNKELAAQLHCAPATISWHLKRLREQRVIAPSSCTDERCRKCYMLACPADMQRILLRHCRSVNDPDIEAYAARCAIR